MTIDRRKLFQMSAAAGAAGLIMPSLSAAEDAPHPRSNRFMLYVHMGSSCGMAAGLIQPQKPGSWPTGYFQAGADAGSNNPLLNSHTEASGLVFHDYLKFLAPMAKDMCLVNGTPTSLDHFVAYNLQTRGSPLGNVAPMWPMAVAEFMRSDARKNPIVLTSGSKSPSVGHTTSIRAANLGEFQTITTDANSIRDMKLEPFSNILKKRFAGLKPGSVWVDPSIGDQAAYQISTLSTGMPELLSAKDDIAALQLKLNAASVSAHVAACAESGAIAGNAADSFRNQLVLAGIMAKTGIASGMTIDAISEDTHGGGADVDTARHAAGRWALLSLFWQWIKSVGLDDDVMIVVGQEFARSPYNKDFVNATIRGLDGASVQIVSPGRDHSFSMGMMFINAKVPSGGRIGVIGSNMVPQASKDAKGTVDPSAKEFSSESIVGSMLMRCFDDLFPTERMVRKHWPTFVPNSVILA
ncbi:MAG: DUF1501 domain-containing protein [Oligoflexus sp.]|nr:DUF1501 domain-containing protein [Oligoflexus sp.]